MPSLAQGYGQGLLLGLQLEERKRRLKEGELTDEFLRERIEDVRFQRKTLMSQLKEQEAEKKRQVEEKEIQTGVAHLGMQPGGEYTVGKLLEEAPETVREPLYSALDLVPGLTSGEQLQRTRVEEKVEGAPRAVPFLGQYLPEEIRPEAAEMAYGFKPKAGAGITRRMTDAERAEAYSQISEDQRTSFQQNFLNKYFRATGRSSLEDQIFGEIGVGEDEERPGGLPPSLIDELGEFESFEDWYDSLSPDAQEELDIEPETLKAIRDWYAVPQ